MEQWPTAMSQSGAILRSYKDHSEIMARLRARDPARVVAGYDRHLYHIYGTTRAIFDAMGQWRSDASAPTPKG
jgi:DNA-binding GntR family transcriptional regulator